MTTPTVTEPVVLITGAARRIGGALAAGFHAAGYSVAAHFGTSAAEALALVEALNQKRPASAIAIAGDLADPAVPERLIRETVSAFGGLNVLINNAALYFPTPIGTIDLAVWDTLMNVNLRAPLMLAQLAAPYLRERLGSIINLTDIHCERPGPGYSVYAASKTGLLAVTRCLAKELAPEVRVNAIAPGAILWPDGAPDHGRRREVLARTPLGRTGDPQDIVAAALFLAEGAPFVTGQTINVDGGQSLS